MDFMILLHHSATGFLFLLVNMCYAMRYPEDILLRGMQVAGVARALVQFFSQVGLPKEILTDKGTTFMLTLVKQLCKLLKIKQLFTTIYHPQMDDFVKRMN